MKLAEVKTYTKIFIKKTFTAKVSQSGFSLVEILIALTLIGIAGSFVVGKIFESLKEGQVSATKTQVRNLANLMKDYRRRCNRYPSTEQGLDALVAKPTTGKECKNYPPEGFLDGAIPQDPWGEEFVYSFEGKKIDIVSFGPDQEEDTDDDISLSQLQGRKKDSGE